MKKGILCAMIFLALLQVVLWSGQGGLLEFLGLQNTLQAQMHDNRTLLERNATLVGDVIDLKEGSDAVEERARNEMGLVKPGETFYQVVTDD